MYKPNSSEVALGDLSQEYLDRWLDSQGYYKLPAHLAGGGKAALITSGGDWLRSFDTLASKDGKTKWFDSKGKSNSTFRYIQGTEWHGIDQACWEDYKEIVRLSGISGYIAVLEMQREIARGEFVDSGMLLIYPLSIPVRHYSRKDMSHKYGKNGMIYWLRDSYDECFTIQEILENATRS